MSGPLRRRIRVVVEFEYPDWFNDTPFACLLEEPLVDSVAGSFRALFDAKAKAVVHKWTMLQFPGAELDVLSRAHARRYAGVPGIPLETQLYITCKVEAFLMLAKSLLDILS